jgi:hypothetical protein
MTSNSVDSHSSSRVALTFDPEEYLHFLEESDWTEPQKREFIEALWTIVVGFVDMGFHIHPVQQALDETKTLEPDSPSVVSSQCNSNSIETGIVAPQEWAAKGSDS